ncbi:hypothetical protein LINGRAPRIM_LOCUS3224 [Linum grandiflorum]
MAGSKVLLTYKRKLSSSGNGTGNGDGCYNSLAGGGTNNAHLTRALQPDGQMFPGCAICGSRGNLLKCNDCHQLYHQQCLNSIPEPKHFQNGEKLSCRCEQQGSSGHESVNGRSELASGDIDESGVSLVTVTPYEGSPGKEALLCLESFEKSPFLKPAFSGRICHVEYDANSSILEASNAEGNNSISTNLSCSLPSRFPGKSKSKTLITFSRRCKKKTKITVLDGKESPLDEAENSPSRDKLSVSSCSAAPPTDCYADQSARQKLPEENTNTRSVSCQSQDEVCLLFFRKSILMIIPLDSLLTEGEESRNVESVCEDNIPSPGLLPHNTSEPAMGYEHDTAEDCSQIVLKSDTRDPHSSIVLDAQLQGRECQDKPEDKLRKEIIPGSGMDDMQADSNFPKTQLFNMTSGSSGTLDCDMDVDICNESAHGASEARLDSRKSMSRIHANCEPVEVSNVRGAESYHVHSDKMQDGMSSSMQEIVRNSKDEGEAAAKNKCLQVSIVAYSLVVAPSILSSSGYSSFVTMAPAIFRT